MFKNKMNGPMNFLIVSSVLLVLCALLTRAVGGQNDLKISGHRQQFILSQKILGWSQTWSPVWVNIESKGEIRWIEQDPNNLKFEVKMAKIITKLTDPNLNEKYPKPPPFTASVCVSKDKDVPFSVEITKGKGNHQALGIQYSTVVTLSDLMFATAIKKEFEVKERGKHNRFKVTYAEDVRLCQFGVRKAFVYSDRTGPNEFVAFPHMTEEGVKGSDLVSFYHSQGEVSYYYRFLDHKTGFATRAVNFRGSVKDAPKQWDYAEMILIADDPKKFSEYDWYELKVSDIK